MKPGLRRTSRTALPGWAGRLAGLALLLGAAVPPTECQPPDPRRSAQPSGETATSASLAASAAESAAGTSNPLAEYFKALKADEFNPWMADTRFASQTPRRGGSITVRAPSAFGTLNPILVTGANDRDVVNYLFDSLIRLDYETLEFKPRMAWSWEDRDVVVRKDGTRLTGVITEQDEKSIRFVSGATRRTFLKNDLASCQPGAAGSMVLKEKWGGGRFQGAVTAFAHTVKLDTSRIPDAKVESIPLDALATYEVKIGDKTEVRPAAKPVCYFRFFLRPNLTWSDNQPLDSDDFVFTLDVIRNPNIKDAANLRNYYLDLEEYRSLGAGREIEFFWHKHYFKALDFSGGEDLTPLPRHIFKPESHEGDPAGFADAFVKHEFARSPVGCGPYQFEQWQNDRLSIVRNPTHFSQEADLPYFTREQPYLDKITWVVIENRTVSIQELQKGAIDIDPEVEPDTWVAQDTSTPEFVSRFARAQRTGLLYTYIGWNLDRPWFRDTRVRKALAMLVPTERLGKDIHFGMVRRVSQPFFIDGPVYDPSLPPVPYDPQGARRLLREAGWLDRNRDGVLENEVEVEENGKTMRKMIDFHFEYLIHTAKAYHEQIANILKEDFGKAGIKMDVRPLEFASFLKGVVDQNFDACRLAWGTTIDGDPFQIWHSSQAVKGGSNHIGFRNKECDEILERAREEFDPVRRWGRYRRMSRIIYDEQPMCFLFAFQTLYLYDAKFRGVKLYPTEYPIDFTEWWIAGK